MSHKQHGSMNTVESIMITISVSLLFTYFVSLLTTNWLITASTAGIIFATAYLLNKQMVCKLKKSDRCLVNANGLLNLAVVKCLYLSKVEEPKQTECNEELSLN